MTIYTHTHYLLRKTDKVSAHGHDNGTTLQLSTDNGDPVAISFHVEHIPALREAVRLLEYQAAEAKAVTA